MLIPVYIYVLGVILSFILAYFSMPLVLKLAVAIGAVDQPSSRKMHCEPMPRLGGLGMFFAFMAVMLITQYQHLNASLVGILLGAAIIAATGIIDDVFRLSPWIKLAAQIGAALVAVHYGVKMQVVTNPFDGVFQLGFYSIPLTVLWIIGVTNAVNLIDGLDGLAGGVAGIAALTIGIVAFREGQFSIAFIALVLAGAVAGFLPYNFHPAKTFMGDTGSMFLGFILSCISIAGMAKSVTVISLLVPVVILAIPIFDTFFAIVRRVNNGKPIFKPDKEHLHHRLIALGYGHRKSVLIIYGISAFVGLVAVGMTFVTSPQAMLIVAFLFLLLLIGAARIGIFGQKADEELAEIQEEPLEVSVPQDQISKGV